MSIFAAVATDGWVWFEEGLAYDNARLSQALIVTGDLAKTKTSRYVDTGLKSLRWLVTRQTSAKGPLNRRSAPRDLATSAPTATAVRPAAAGGYGNHRGLPRRMARRS